MNDLFNALVGAAGIVTLASLFAPQGKMNRSVRFIFSLLAFSLVAAPVLSALDMNDPAFDVPVCESTGESGGSMIFERSEAELKKSISRACEIPEESIDVSICYTNDGGVFAIKSILVHVDSIYGTAKVYTFLHSITAGDCEVTVSGR